MNAYLAWKLVHILASTVVLGTGAGIAYFAWFGYRRALAIGQLEGLRTVLRLTVIADMVFTAPAIVVQFVSGLVLMNLNGWSLTSAWSLTAIALFIIVGLLWLPVVGVQIAMSRAANEATTIQSLSPRFHRQFLAWFFLGVPAFLIVIGIFYLMVAKPLSVT